MTDADTPGPPRPAERISRAPFRPDIEGLRAIAVIAADTALMPRLASEKLRSRNRASGSRGSLRFCTACHTTNSASTTMPAMISDQTLIGPTIVPQS